MYHVVIVLFLFEHFSPDWDDHGDHEDCRQCTWATVYLPLCSKFLRCIRLCWHSVAISTECFQGKTKRKQPFLFSCSRKKIPQTRPEYSWTIGRNCKIAFFFSLLNELLRMLTHYDLRGGRRYKRKKVVFLSLRCWAFPFSIFPRTQSSNNEDNDRVWFFKNLVNNNEKKLLLTFYRFGLTCLSKKVIRCCLSFPYGPWRSNCCRNALSMHSERDINVFWTLWRKGQLAIATYLMVRHLSIYPPCHPFLRILLFPPSFFP